MASKRERAIEAVGEILVTMLEQIGHDYEISEAMKGDPETWDLAPDAERIIETFERVMAEPDEGEPDRLAVVTAADSDEIEVVAIDRGETTLNRNGWRFLEQQCISGGPYARQIVEVHLKRPAEPAVVQGRVVG